MSYLTGYITIDSSCDYELPSKGANKDDILAAVSRHGYALRNTSDDMKNDKDVGCC